MNMATMVAGTVLSQLRALSDAVERVASEEEAARALEAGDWTTLQNISKATYEFYEDPSHGLKPSGISPFDAWTFMNKDGDQRAKFGRQGRQVTGPGSRALRRWGTPASWSSFRRARPRQPPGRACSCNWRSGQASPVSPPGCSGFSRLPTGVGGGPCARPPPPAAPGVDHSSVGFSRVQTSSTWPSTPRSPSSRPALVSRAPPRIR